MNPKERLLNFLLPEEGLSSEESLYYRDSSALCRAENGAILVPEGATLSFDTYFNSLDYEAIKRFTAINSLAVSLFLQGSFHVRILRSERTPKGASPVQEEIAMAERGKELVPVSLSNYVLYEGDFSSESKKEMQIGVDLCSFKGRGILFAELTAGKGGGSYFGGHIDAIEEVQTEKVKIGIVITTFKRENFVIANVSKLTKELPAENFGVFVIDNGRTLSEADVPGATLLPNKNLGGSGGFTRGIMEILKRNGEYTHVLLTDDDIRFHSEIFLRALSLVRYALSPEKLTIGASMMRLDKTYLQHEYGANWLGYTLTSKNHNFDLREKLSLIRNAESDIPDYTAWWFNCFSLALPMEKGLPLPLFIKGDDIEYGLRSGNDVLLMNGIGVWHERFEMKYSGELEYYIKRNEAIINALYRPDLNWFFHFKKLVVAVGKQLVYQRYFAVDLIFKAYKDFIRGANYLNALDAEKLHGEIRAVVQKQKTLEELVQMGYDVSKHEIFTPSKKQSKNKVFQQVITLNGYLLPKWTYNRRERRTFRLVNMMEPQPKSFFRAYRVVQYNPETKMAFVTKQKLWRVFHTGWRLILCFFSMLFKFRHAKNSYRKKFDRLTSFESWKKRLDF